MKTKLKLFYCYTDRGQIEARSRKPENYDQFEFKKNVNAPNDEVAKAVYIADLRNGIIPRNQ